LEVAEALGAAEAFVGALEAAEALEEAFAGVFVEVFAIIIDAAAFAAIDAAAFAADPGVSSNIAPECRLSAARGFLLFILLMT
jgi:hypothetical protein